MFSQAKQKQHQRVSHLMQISCEHDAWFPVLFANNCTDCYEEMDREKERKRGSKTPCNGPYQRIRFEGRLTIAITCYNARSAPFNGNCLRDANWQSCLLFFAVLSCVWCNWVYCKIRAIMCRQIKIKIQQSSSWRNGWLHRYQTARLFVRKQNITKWMLGFPLLLVHTLPRCERWDEKLLNRWPFIYFPVLHLLQQPTLYDALLQFSVHVLI